MAFSLTCSLAIRYPGGEKTSEWKFMTMVIEGPFLGESVLCGVKT